MAYILYIYTKKGFLRVQNFVIMSLWQFLAILAIKIAEFFKLEHFLRPFLKTKEYHLGRMEEWNRKEMQLEELPGF